MESNTSIREASSEPNYVTDVVVVGTGPAGGSLASFLGSYDIKGIIIGMTNTTAVTPRAHITNMAALECLRDINLEDEARRLGSPKETLMHTRWGYSMAGDEYARVYSWGNGPELEGKYAKASPCPPVDCPQSELEPILVRKATMSGFVVRFNTEFISFEDNTEKGHVDVLVKDLVFNSTYTIRCRYLFGADGARSKIMRQLDLPLKQKEGGGLAWNVLVRADLSKHMENRKGNLHWCYQHDYEHPDFAWIGFPRMVKPWHEWVFIMFPVQGYQPNPPPTEEQWMKRIKYFIGDDSVDVEILNISKWMINDIVAEKYAKGNVFALGDAVHRHPPANGLGSNTCIQDSYNLAWKVAYVMKGLAGPELLDSYEKERQPVGQAIVERAFQGYLDHLPMWQSTGILAPDPATRVADFSELSAATTVGRNRRKAFFDAVRGTKKEYQGLGIEMNQRYQSDAIVTQNEEGGPPDFKGDFIFDHTKSTYPGSRLPHIWLNKRIPQKPVPIMDLAGKGRFALLTGIGGEKWKDAAKEAGEALGIPIAAYSIGIKQDWEDPYLEWEDVREVDEDGCVLVRPDRFIAWRSFKMAENPANTLKEVLKKVLAKNN